MTETQFGHLQTVLDQFKRGLMTPNEYLIQVMLILEAK